MGIFNKFTWLCFSFITEPYKEKYQVGQPIHLGKSRLHSILTRGGEETNNFKYLHFHSLDDYSPSDRRGNIGLSSAWLILIALLSDSEFYKKWKKQVLNLKFLLYFLLNIQKEIYWLCIIIVCFWKIWYILGCDIFDKTLSAVLVSLARIEYMGMSPIIIMKVSSLFMN